MSARDLAFRWLIAFVITQVVECAVYTRGFGVRLGVAFGASAITHPVVCFVIPKLWEAMYLAAILRGAGELSPTAYFVTYGALAESFAVVVEAFYLLRVARLAPRRALLASVAANAASGLTGLACSYLLGYP